MNEIIRAQLLMQLILEDFDMDENDMRINQILLSEDESPIDIINTLDKDKETKKESDEESDEIKDLLGIDTLVDKLEDEKDDNDEFGVNFNKTDTLHVKVSEDDSFEKEDNNDIKPINVILKDIKNEVNVNVKDNDDIEKNNLKTDIVNVNVNDQVVGKNDIKVNITDTDDNKDSGADIHLKLKNKDKDDIIVRLKNEKSNSESDDEDADIKINLTNVDNKSAETKTSLFIKKRDELIQSDDPNMQLSVCTKIIVDLKKSLERLINFVPDEIILVRTKYLLGDALDEILESSDLILKDPKKIKDIIYKVFDMIISVNEYIESKYIQLEDKLDNQSKEQEDKDISKQLNDTEDQNNNDNLNNFENNETKLIKRPNINRQKI